jgi:hypothetical protein
MMTAKLVLSTSNSGPELDLQVTVCGKQLLAENNLDVAEYLRIMEVNVSEQRVVVRSKLKNEQVVDLHYIVYEDRLLCL